ncbi:hypothetical protein TNCV_4170491 [Trichonephila clavipes]|nr:hypothetical protein TNCV_4170491 [Trichonephila clavipes]
MVDKVLAYGTEGTLIESFLPAYKGHSDETRSLVESNVTILSTQKFSYTRYTYSKIVAQTVGTFIPLRHSRVEFIFVEASRLLSDTGLDPPSFVTSDNLRPYSSSWNLSEKSAMTGPLKTVRWAAGGVSLQQPTAILRLSKIKAFTSAIVSGGMIRYTRAFGDGPRHFEPWSSDVDVTLSGGLLS